MKHSYEIPVVFRITPNEEEMQQAIDQVVSWLENSTEFEDAGKVTKIDRSRLGRRRLEYEIKGQRDAQYVLIYADVEPKHLPEFELNMKLYDPVLRYLFLRDEPVKAEVSSDDTPEDAGSEDTDE